MLLEYILYSIYYIYNNVLYNIITIYILLIYNNIYYYNQNYIIIKTSRNIHEWNEIRKINKLLEIVERLTIVIRIIIRQHPQEIPCYPETKKFI